MNIVTCWSLPHNLVIGVPLGDWGGDGGWDWDDDRDGGGDDGDWDGESNIGGVNCVTIGDTGLSSSLDGEGCATISLTGLSSTLDPALGSSAVASGSERSK